VTAADRPLLGIVTGLSFEAQHAERAARRLRNSSVLVASAAGNPARARAVAISLRDRGATVLASFGIAGGLQPGLAPGAIVVADAVIPTGGARVAADPDLVERLSAGKTPVTVGTIVGIDRPVATAAAKAALHRGLGGIAVDMESHAIASVAEAASLPFVVVRIIADPAERDIPAAALAALDIKGNLRLGAILRALGRNPGEISGLLRLARDMARARGGLRRGAALLCSLKLSGLTP
jgi:hopanoid-associated phosphorylase